MSPRKRRSVTPPASLMCVQCAWNNLADAEACGRCGRPFTLAAWQANPPPVKRVTIDSNCINAHQGHPVLGVLERWQSEGKFVIEKAAVMIEDLARADAEQREKAQSLPEHPKGSLIGVPGRSEIGVTTRISGPDMRNELRAIMFPNGQPLSDDQTFDLEHLRSHVLTGADVLVTMDPKDFIRRQRKDRRKQIELRRFGIWVFEPEEFVKLCRETYGWL